ncbi:hypothetical protein L593_07200 [Salinarchaeum sp. Harcht-Bsk1]|uniref:HVO_0234 family beta-propeller protein n=1 Tax=Salinarchaeum sp. Harcht-Bsk1 TaxID=1333523 RepID=UPI00034242C2|nr:hypothetical protein [Salinarchaeum sp. Harcht-Bsk1]AGN01387.1 hypothetical protein L593_07200 [Salinarchaeum sp. Harcht-Bsk1]
MDIAEKRVYETSAGRSRLAVATAQGLAVVGISADVIGEFGLALRDPVRDVAALGDGRVLAATPEDLLVVALGADRVAETVGTVPTDAGPTDAVTITGDAVIAAGADGAVRRAPMASVLDAAPAADSGSATAVAWRAIGEADVRAAGGRLLAAADGVYRVDTDAIEHVGLDDVRDVAAPGGVEAVGPFAATADGLFRLGPGWVEEREGPFDVVAAAGESASAAGEPTADGEQRVHAASGKDLLARTDDGWTSTDWPARAPVAGIAYGTGDDAAGAEGTPPTFAVAADGTVLADAGDGWRTRSIGLPDVAACAIVR